MMPLQYHFAHYSFEHSQGLRFKDTPIHLPPKEKGLLQALLEARGQIVRKDALVESIWDHQAASDESISRTVYRLRVAMLSCEGGDVIETIYNTGFRIKVPIRVGNAPYPPSESGLHDSYEPLAIAALQSAREYLARRTTEDIEAAAGATRIAILKDPSYAAAWSTMAEIRLFQLTRSLHPPREAASLAKEAAQSALRIAPSCACALSIRGWVRALMEQDPLGGMEDLDQALKIDPNSWLVALLRGWALQAAGRHEESVAMMRWAQAQNPSSHRINALPALYLMLAGDLDGALDEARSLAHRFSTIDDAQCIAATVCSVTGHHKEAVAFGRRAQSLAPGTPSVHAALAYACANAGMTGEAKEVLDSIEASRLPQPSALTAAVYLALGLTEKAIERLADAFERGVPQFAWARDDPRFAALRGNSVVEALWARICPPSFMPSSEGSVFRL